MKNATRGLVAGGLGVALLAGGATFALWSDTADVDGGTITAGNLDVSFVSSQWFDVSDDREDNPHAIDLEEFLIVPGDTIQGRYAIDGALAGDNMVAGLSVTADGTAAGELLAEEAGVTVTYDVIVNGATIFSGVDIDEATDVRLYASEDNSFDDGGVLPRFLDGETDIEVIVEAVFDGDTEEQVRVNTNATLAGLTVNLEQVRTDAHGFNG